jgi:hypothetical protein
MHGNGAPGIFRELGLQSAGGCSPLALPLAHTHTHAKTAVNVVLFTAFSS